MKRVKYEDRDPVFISPVDTGFLLFVRPWTRRQRWSSQNRGLCSSSSPWCRAWHRVNVSVYLSLKSYLNNVGTYCLLSVCSLLAASSKFCIWSAQDTWETEATHTAYCSAGKLGVWWEAHAFYAPPRHCWVKRYQGTNWPAPSLGSPATTYNKTKAEYRQAHLGDFCLGSLWDSECATPYAIKAWVSLSSCLDVPQPPGERGAYMGLITWLHHLIPPPFLFTQQLTSRQSRGDKS